jgi:hypothetical protein
LALLHKPVNLGFNPFMFGLPILKPTDEPVKIAAALNGLGQVVACSVQLGCARP